MEIAALMKIASTQHLCVSRTQALEVMNLSQLEHLLRSSVLQRVHQGVYKIAGSPRTWRQAAVAATLSIPNSALSYGAAAKLHGLTFAAREQLEITTSTSYAARRNSVVIHRSSQLAPFVTEVDNIPVTKVERTIVDVSRYMTSRQVGAVIDQARVLKLTTAMLVNECVDAMSTRGYRRVASLREALEVRLDNDTDIDSFLERRVLKWIESNGFPKPQTQIWYRKCERPYRLDIWYEDRRIDIEPNGPHHLLPHYALEDAKRDAQLSTRGVLVIRVPLDMEQHEFVDLLREAFLSRPL